MINKNYISHKLFREKDKDYTYAIVFFLIFSFFILFAIKPSISTAFSLSKKLEDLKRVDGLYEKQVTQIIRAQSKLENLRDSYPLLEEAFPKAVQLSKVIEEIKSSAQKNNLNITKISINNINLMVDPNTQKTNTFSANLEIEGKFSNLISLIEEIKNQRRLKSIKNLITNRSDTMSSDSAKLKISIETEGYYL